MTQPIQSTLDIRGSPWIEPTRAAFDFRSDVRTTPTLEMLQAIANASLEDGIAQSDPSTESLEATMAAVTGKPAALFVASGTMGNILGVRMLLEQPPYAVLCDSRAHLLKLEAGGVLALASAVAQPVMPANERYLTLEDIEPHIQLDRGQSVHMCPTRVISLENTLRGMVTPLAEVQRIAEFARQHGIKMHLDGARLWEVAASGAGTVAEYCACFDTVTMCFSKGLGAPVGSILVGEAAIIKRARWFKQSIGGGIRQPGLLSAAAKVAYEKTFLGGLLPRTHTVARDLSTFWESLGGKLLHPTETNILWLDCSGPKFTLADLCRLGAEKGLYIDRDRLIVHYQISDDAVSRLKEVVNALFSVKA